MAYSGLNDFIADLERNKELHRIKVFVNPSLEISEITDRVTKAGGTALLFENNGSGFPLLINAFGSDKRMAMAFGKNEISETVNDIETIFNLVTDSKSQLSDKIFKLPGFFRLSSYLPVKKKRKGLCQAVIHSKPDLGIFPVLKCWPHDGGRYITLPMVHTIDPVSGKTNVGMYRMQILDSNRTAMHWQRHKTGANHFMEWNKTGKKMPVSVTLGGDPVYTYCATAPLPENVSEYILAGFLRKKRINLVKCITNDLYVPEDADIVIEGYVDPKEDLIREGPFGDHTGFYSLSDLYPVFHVVCITHSRNAIYPATIVGFPPQEDAWLTKATEKIFLPPIKIAIQPEIEDFHMPEAGVAHNLVIVKIKKSYPGQGMKVINSLFGAGQMMFTKYLIVTNGDLNIRNYAELITWVFLHTSFETDILFTRGPLDVLDHSSDRFSFGGKAGIDATTKLEEEIHVIGENNTNLPDDYWEELPGLLMQPFIKSFNMNLVNTEIPVLIVSADISEDQESVARICRLFKGSKFSNLLRLVIVADHTVNPDDLFVVAWQTLANSDPLRDHYYLSCNSLLIDATIKYYRKGGFPRQWPEVVCSDVTTINKVDSIWNTLGFETFLPSPSLKLMNMKRGGSDSVS